MPGRTRRREMKAAPFEPGMARRFAPLSSPAWSKWRAVEKDGDAAFRYCGDCGFVHRRGNHAPRREP